MLDKSNVDHIFFATLLPLERLYLSIVVKIYQRRAFKLVGVASALFSRSVALTASPALVGIFNFTTDVVSPRL